MRRYFRDVCAYTKQTSNICGLIGHKAFSLVSGQSGSTGYLSLLEIVERCVGAQSIWTLS